MPPTVPDLYMIATRRLLRHRYLKALHNRAKFRYRRFKGLYLQNFVFIHINKTGGTSITTALGIQFEHKTALEKRAELGSRRYHRRFSFAIIRNPWDKVVSHYHYRVQTNQTGLRDAGISFQDWVKLTYKEQDPTYYDNPKMFMPQWQWITDHEGHIIVDFVGRFENLDADFKKICLRLDLPGRTLSHAKKSSHRPYPDYYDTVTKDIIAQWFSKDIENFGYEFEI